MSESTSQPEPPPRPTDPANALSNLSPRIDADLPAQPADEAIFPPPAVANLTTPTGLPEAPQRRSFSAAFLGTLLSTGAINIIGAISGIVAARLLGPEARGQLTTLIFYPIFFGTLGTLGVQRSLAFEISRRPKEQANLVTSGMFLSFVFSLPLALVCWLILPLLVTGEKAALLEMVQFFSLAMILQVQYRVVLASPQGAFQFNRYNLVRLILPGMYMVSMLAAWALGWVSPLAFAMGYVVGQLLGVLAGVIAAWQPIRRGKIIWQEMTQLLESGLRFHTPEVLGLLLENLDKAFVVRFLTDHEVGLYTVATAVATLQQGVGFAFTEVGFVMVAGEKDPIAARNTLLKQVRAAQVVLLSMAVVFSLLAGWIIQTAFGEEYADATHTTVVLIGAINLLALVRILNSGLRVLGYTWAAAVSYSVAVVVLGIGAMLYLPAGGILSMAYVTLAAAATALLACMIFLRLLSKAPLYQMWGLTPETVQILYSTIRNKLKRRTAGPA